MKESQVPRKEPRRTDVARKGVWSLVGCISLFAHCSYKLCFLSPGLDVFIVFTVRNAVCFLGLVTTVSGCHNKEALKTYGSKSVG